MEGFRIKPIMFFRYLDDIFFIWPGTREELTEFGDYLNSLIPSIKITLNVSDTHIDFLDTIIFKQTITSGFCCLTVSTFYRYNNCKPFLYSGPETMNAVFAHIFSEQVRISNILKKNVKMIP